MRCTNCQHENNPAARRCEQCGAPLSTPSHVTEDTQVFRRADLRTAAGGQASGGQASADPAQPQRTARSPYARPLPTGGEATRTARTATRRNPQAAQARPADDAVQAPVRQAADAPTHSAASGRMPAQGGANARSRQAARTAAPRDEAYRRRTAPPVYDPDEIEDDEVEEPDTDHTYAKPRRNTMLIAGISALSFMALMLLIICFLTFTAAGQRWKAGMGMNAPASAYWQLGDEALAAGNADAAAEHYEAALSRDSANYDGALKLAQTLMSAGNAERAERAYRLAITLRPTESAPYDRVLELMAARGAGESEMVDMLRLAYQNTSNESYHTQLLTYGPSAVRFDPEEGAYDYAIKLQMASDEGATIYYTTDGSQPTIYSSKYVLPIELGEGVFTVRAIAYLNDLYSGETHKTYTITFPTVQTPQFSSKPGKYSADDDGRKVIKVSVPEGCTVYYTTDGSTPDEDAREYEDGISLKPGTYTVRIAARNSDGEFSAENSAEYEVIGELKAPFTDDDRFKSFFVDVTTQDDVNKQFKKLVETTGDTNTFFTQHYSFGEVDFTVKDGVPLVTAVRITNNDITGVRGTKVGWDAEDVIALFRDEKHDIANGERVLYTLDHDRYGWVEYGSDGEMTSINYMYTRDDLQLVELHYAIENGEVSAIEYCISDM